MFSALGLLSRCYRDLGYSIIIFFCFFSLVSFVIMVINHTGAFESATVQSALCLSGSRLQLSHSSYMQVGETCSCWTESCSVVLIQGCRILARNEKHDHVCHKIALKMYLLDFLWFHKDYTVDIAGLLHKCITSSCVFQLHMQLHHKHNETLNTALGLEAWPLYLELEPHYDTANSGLEKIKVCCLIIGVYEIYSFFLNITLNMWLDRDLLCMACLGLKKGFDTVSTLSNTFPLQMFPLKRAESNCKNFLCGLFCWYTTSQAFSCFLN